MATLEQFHPWISLECPNVPPSLINDAVVRGARAFAERTHAVEYETFVVLPANTVSFTPVLPPGEEVESVLSVVALKAGTDEPASSSVSVVESDPVSILAIPTPEVDYSLSVVVATKPSFGTSRVSDIYFKWYRNAVVDYALYVLMSQASQLWANPQVAMDRYKSFARAADAIRVKRLEGSAGVESRVQMRPLA